MNMSVKMLADIAVHAQAMADAAQAMAAAMQAVVDDCAGQVAARKDGNKDTHSSCRTGTEPDWVAESEAMVPEQLPTPDTAPTDSVSHNARSEKRYTVAEVRAFVAERSKPENRPKIRAILKSLGVSKLTELPEDKYGQLMEEVSRL